jgi:AhpD family alkylhydroperoxidase
VVGANSLLKKWTRWKKIMGREGSLDSKTKEIIALTVSLVRDCEYCSNAHEAIALMRGASRKKVVEVKQVVDFLRVL